MTLDTDTFEKFEKSLLAFGSLQYDGLDEDDDPLGHCLIVAEDGGLTMMAIDSGMLAPEKMQELFIGVCGTIIKEKAVRIGWLLSMYEVDMKRGDPPPTANFADDPRRIEVFQATAVEADRVAAHIAPILRNPSRVGDWKPKDHKRNPYVEIPQKALGVVAARAEGNN